MKNSLFIKLAGLGDILMVTPAIRAYKNCYPEENIIFIIGRSNQEVLKNNPYIDRLICANDVALFSGSILQKLKAAFELLSSIKESQAHKAFVLHRDWRWNFLFFLSGIQERHGFKRDLRGLFLTHAVEPGCKEHQIHHYFRVLGLPVPFGTKGLNMDIFPGEGEEERINRLLSEFRLGTTIAIAPGGAANTKEQVPLKRWPLEHYRELIRRLLKDGFLIFLIGGKNDYGFTKTLTEFFSKADGNQLHDLSGKYSLSETCAFLKKCRLMVTHDSGPMHIAAAAQIPVIALFGPTAPEATKPLTRGSNYFWRGNRLSCAPCYHNGKFPDCKTKNCMNGITPDEVYEKIKETLEV